MPIEEPGRTQELLDGLSMQLGLYHHETLVDGLSHLPDFVLERLEKEWRLAHGRRRREREKQEASHDG